jgi:hypothetical protein
MIHNEQEYRTQWKEGRTLGRGREHRAIPAVAPETFERQLLVLPALV